MRNKSMALILTAIAFPVAAQAQSPGSPDLTFTTDVIYKTSANGAGPQTAVLYGSPAKPGVFVMRMKFPAGVKIMPLTHPDAWRTAVVLSGTLYYAIGEKWDESKLTAYPTGTFFSTPTSAPHYVWAKDGEVVVQFTAMGPTGTTPVPQK